MSLSSIQQRFVQLGRNIRDAIPPQDFPIPSLDSFFFLCSIKTLIQKLDQWTAELSKLEQAIREIRQSFGKQCPKVILSFIFGFLHFDKQRAVMRTNHLWYTSGVYMQKGVYLNETVKSVGMVSLAEKYKILIKQMPLSSCCSVVANNHCVAIAEHFSLYIHHIGSSLVIPRLFVTVDQVIHLNNQNQLVFANSGKRYRINLSDKTLHRELLDMDVCGITDSGQVIHDQFVHPHYFKRDFVSSRVRVCGEFEARELLLSRDRDYRVAICISDVQTNQLVRFFETFIWGSEYTFNAQMMITWENDFLECFRFQDQSIVKSIFPFRILSADINGQNELTLLSCEDGHLYLRVYDMN